MKYMMSLVIALCLCLTGAACTSDKAQQREEIQIGVALYNQYDTFVGELMDSFLEQVREKEQAEGVTITVLRENAGGSQEAQNNQVQRFIDAGCDILCVNLVDRMDASVIIDKAEQAGIPIVFFNRELVEEDLRRSEQLYYIGADAEMSGHLQGQIVADLWAAQQEELDKNEDGILQYVMLEGEPDHQDSIMRTEASIKAVTDFGIAVERLEDDIANWERSQGKTKMLKWLDIHGERIEVVFANNDDMALGAIDALKDIGMPSSEWPVIVGVDGTTGGLKAVLLGEMSGTVYNDSDGQAEALLDLSYRLATGGPMPDLEAERYVLLPYKIVTSGNILDFIDNE